MWFVGYTYLPGPGSVTTAAAALVSSMAETDERLPMLSEAAGDSPAQTPSEDIHKPVTTQVNHY